jgi:hypothetical protein
MAAMRHRQDNAVEEAVATERRAQETRRGHDKHESDAEIARLSMCMGAAPRGGMYR